MAIRPYGGTIRNFGQVPRARVAELIPLVGARINQGMITTLDPTDIPESALALAFNARVRYDKTSRRRGTVSFGTPDPDANKVLSLYNYKDNTGVGKFFRFTSAGIYYDPDSWTAIVGTLTGSDSDRFNIATAFTQIVFTNSGIDPIQLIDQVADTFAQLGNAPRYKYITVFANRVVGANNNDPTTPNPIELGWSGDGNIAEWDQLVDQSAGAGPLIESPGDNTDFITGVFGFTNVMITLRERSIWLSTKQPVAEDPFNNYAAVPGIGCNCPYSAAVIPGGIVFADQRTEKIYAYTPGDLPQSISTNIEKQLFASISDPLQVFGSYDNRNNEYSISIPLVGTTITRVWTFNFRTQAWAYDERINLSCISDIEGAAQELTIDDLTGTIDNLTGTIDELVGPTSSATSRLYGFADGSLELERLSSDIDDVNAYTTELVSKTFALPVLDQYVARTRYEFYCRTPSIIELWYSTNGGLTWTLARTDSISSTNEPYLLEWNRQVKCRKFTFKIVSTQGDWDLIDYELDVWRSGTSRANS